MGWAISLNEGPALSITVLTVVVARHLGPSATGTIALINSVLEVLLAVFGFGLSTGITYFVSIGQWSVRASFRETMGAAVLIGLASHA